MKVARLVFAAEQSLDPEFATFSAEHTEEEKDEESLEGVQNHKYDLEG